MSMSLAKMPIVPRGSPEAYVATINNIPLLSAEDEHALAVRYTEGGDLEAAKLLVLSHLRFVVHIARSYNGYGLPQGDLIQEGNIGLMKAVKRFNPDIGVRLVSFAVHWIKAEMHEYVLKNWRIVKVATTKAQRKLFFNLRKNKTGLNWLTADETAAVAKELKVPEAEVRRMEARLYSRDTSFDAPNESDNDAVFAPEHYLEDNRYDPARALEEGQFQAHQEDLLLDAMTSLDDRSKTILKRRWLDDKKATLQELADEYGVSAERIRQIENNAMKKLKTAILAA